MTASDRRVNWIEEAFLESASVDMPIHLGAIMILDAAHLLDSDGRFPIEDLRSVISNRIHLGERLHQVPKEMPLRLGAPMWIDVDDVDMVHHLPHSALPAPGTREQLLALVADIQSRCFDPHHPMWEIQVIEGLSGGRVALVPRIHHAMVDGVASVELAQAVTDISPEVQRFEHDSWEVAPVPPPARLLLDSSLDLISGRIQAMSGAASALVHPPSMRDLSELVAAFSRLLGRTGSGPLRGSLQSKRVMSTDEFQFASVKDAARRRRATVNDFVLASAAGGLTQVLAKRGPVPDEILVDAPVSLRGDGRGTRSTGNHLGHLFPILPLNLEPVETLQLVKAQMRTFKTTNAGARFEGVVSTIGLLPTTLRRPIYRALLGRAPGPSAIVTNVPGPPVPLYVLGAPVVGLYPFVSPTAGVGLSAVVTSYNDVLTLTATADSRIVPEPSQFIEGFSNYMTALIGSK